MTSVNLEQMVCRICLENKANFNWNDDISEFSGITYKYCYYKYTQIVETGKDIDADNFPTNLCARCATEVKNAHALFEKALESFIILQNTIKTNGCVILYEDAVDGSQKTIEDNFEENFINKTQDIEIDELICYSPDQGNNMEEAENIIVDSKEISANKNFESLEQQSFDSLEIQEILTLPVQEGSKHKRKVQSLASSLEVNLQVEICCSKLLKSTANKSNIKAFKSYPPAAMKRKHSNAIRKRRKLSRNTTPQRTEFSEQSLFSKIPSDNNTESQKLYFTKKCDRGEQTLKRLTCPLSDLNLDESDANSFDPLSVHSPKNGRKSAVSTLENEEDPNKPSDWSTPEPNLKDKCEINSATFSNINSSVSRESQISSISDSSVDKMNDTFKPSEISLLEQVYGQNFDEKYLKDKSKNRQLREKICQYCSFKVMGTNRLMRHEATHLEHRERNVICPKCGIKLYTKMALSEHIKVHDENRQKEHKCEFCDKAFFHKGALNVHRRIHLGLMVKCQMCPKEFYRQIDLERHLPTHSAAPLQNKEIKKVKYTVQCQYCNKSINTTSWKAHKAAHLKQPEVKCKICNKDYYSRNKCGNHLRRVHHKTADEYEENIHYYVDCIPRMSHLIIKQQETVVPVIK